MSSSESQSEQNQKENSNFAKSSSSNINGSDSKSVFENISKNCQDCALLQNQIEYIKQKNVIGLQDWEQHKRLFSRGVLSSKNSNYQYEPSLQQKSYFQSLHDRSDKFNAQQFIYVQQVDEYQKIQMYSDKYPFLSLRKGLRLFRAFVSNFCLKIIKHPTFEAISLVVIVWNSINLAFQDPTAEKQSDAMELMDDIFLILYSIEMGLKIIGMGFIFNKRAYLRDAWNILDFVIVSTAYIPIFIGGQGSGVNLSGLRSLRVLRPLRTISSVRSLKVLLQSFFQSLPMLCDTFMVLMFVFLIFGIAGLQLFQGLLKQRCFLQETGEGHPDDLFCGNQDCPIGYFCGKGIDNPNYGVTNFDNIMYSLLQVFIISSLEGWSEIMSWIRLVFSDFAVVYFILVIFFCSYMILNMMLAVIKAQFSQENEKNQQLDQQQQVQQSDASSNNQEGGSNQEKKDKDNNNNNQASQDQNKNNQDQGQEGVDGDQEEQDLEEADVEDYDLQHPFYYSLQQLQEFGRIYQFFHRKRMLKYVEKENDVKAAPNYPIILKQRESEQKFIQSSAEFLQYEDSGKHQNRVRKGDIDTPVPLIVKTHNLPQTNLVAISRNDRNPDQISSTPDSQQAQALKEIEKNENNQKQQKKDSFKQQRQVSPQVFGDQKSTEVVKINQLLNLNGDRKISTTIQGGEVSKYPNKYINFDTPPRIIANKVQEAQDQSLNKNQLPNKGQEGKLNQEMSEFNLHITNNSDQINHLTRTPEKDEQIQKIKKQIIHNFITTSIYKEQKQEEQQMPSSRSNQNLKAFDYFYQTDYGSINNNTSYGFFNKTTSGIKNGSRIRGHTVDSENHSKFFQIDSDRVNFDRATSYEQQSRQGKGKLKAKVKTTTNPDSRIYKGDQNRIALVAPTSNSIYDYNNSRFFKTKYTEDGNSLRKSKIMEFDYQQIVQQTINKYNPDNNLDLRQFLSDKSDENLYQTAPSTLIDNQVKNSQTPNHENGSYEHPRNQSMNNNYIKIQNSISKIENDKESDNPIDPVPEHGHKHQEDMVEIQKNREGLEVIQFEATEENENPKQKQKGQQEAQQNSQYTPKEIIQYQKSLQSEGESQKVQKRVQFIDQSNLNEQQLSDESGEEFYVEKYDEIIEQNPVIQIEQAGVSQNFQEEQNFQINVLHPSSFGFHDSSHAYQSKVKDSIGSIESMNLKQKQVDAALADDRGYRTQQRRANAIKLEYLKTIVDHSVDMKYSSQYEVMCKQIQQERMDEKENQLRMRKQAIQAIRYKTPKYQFLSTIELPSSDSDDDQTSGQKNLLQNNKKPAAEGNYALVDSKREPGENAAQQLEPEIENIEGNEFQQQEEQRKKAIEKEISDRLQKLINLRYNQEQEDENGVASPLHSPLKRRNDQRQSLSFSSAVFQRLNIKNKDDLFSFNENNSSSMNSNMNNSMNPMINPSFSVIQPMIQELQNVSRDASPIQVTPNDSKRQFKNDQFDIPQDVGGEQELPAQQQLPEFKKGEKNSKSMTNIMDLPKSRQDSPLKIDLRVGEDIFAEKNKQIENSERAELTRFNRKTAILQEVLQEIQRESERKIARQANKVKVYKSKKEEILAKINKIIEKTQGNRYDQDEMKKKRERKERLEKEKFINGLDYQQLRKFFAEQDKIFEQAEKKKAGAKMHSIIAKTCPLELEYNSMLQDDFSKNIKLNRNWSGKNVYSNYLREYLQSQKFVQNIKLRRQRIQIIENMIEKHDIIIRALNHQETDIYIPGFFGIIYLIRQIFRKIVENSMFEQLIIICVVANTTVLALNGIVTDETGLSIMEDLNLSFTITFTIEMGLKIFGYGLIDYCRDKMNLFDGAIVIMSLVQLIFLGGSSSAISAFRSVRIFRTFRVLRVTKLLRSLAFMKVIIGVVGRSLSSFIYIALLLMLFLFIYTLLGCQIYAGKFNLLDNDLRSNFDNFNRGFITVFQLLTMENWQQILQLSFHTDVNKAISVVYFLSWIFVGNFSLLNLFLAILLDGFGSPEAQNDMGEGAQDEGGSQIVEEDGIDEDSHEHNHQHNHHKHDDGQGLDTIGITSMHSSNARQTETFNSEHVLAKVPIGGHHPSFMDSKNNLIKDSFRGDAVSVAPSKDNSIEQNQDVVLSEIQGEVQNHEEQNEQQQREKIYQALGCQYSIFLFSKENQFRKLMFKIVQKHEFEGFIIVLIILSSMKLAFDSYLPDQQSDAKGWEVIGTDVSNGLDYFFNVIFTIECLMKIIAYGFIMGEGTYLDDDWSILDFFIVVSSLVDMSVESIDIPALKILRMMRTLRPLRFVSHNVNMKIVVTALMQSFSAIMNVLIVVFLIYLMFSILGISFLQYQMGRCDTQDYYKVSREMCEDRGAQWFILDTNFDHVGHALVSLFIISTMEGWPDIMYTAADANDDSVGPEQDGNILIAYYFIAFILIGSFFFLNLFTGAICYHFDKAHKNEKSCMYSFLTEDQNKWIEMQRMILFAQPDLSFLYIPKSPFRRKLYDIISSNKFETGIMVCILSNILTMALVYEDSSEEYNKVLQGINYFFTVAFLLEALLKMVALGLRGYFASGWNQFDIFVVLASLLDIAMDLFLEGGGFSFLRVGPQLARVIRVLRVSRLFKLVQSFQGLRKVIDTMVLSLPSLLNVGALTLLVLFIYSVLGCFMFGNVTEGNKIDQYNNFSNFHTALLTLFRCSTGEDWFLIMFDVGQTSDCVEGQTCGSSFAIPYFITFVLILKFVMLNLFILIILNDFQEYNLNEDNPVDIFKEHLEKFKDVWGKYCNEVNTDQIHQRHVLSFFITLQPPLGFGKQVDRFIASREILKMKIFSDQNGYIHFNDLLFAAFKRGYGKTFFQADRSKEMAAYIAFQEKNTKQKIKELQGKGTNKAGDQQVQYMLNPDEIQNQEESQGPGRTANPFFTSIFVRMCFTAWIRYSEKAMALHNPEGGLQPIKQFIEESDDSQDDENINININGNGNNNEQEYKIIIIPEDQQVNQDQ